MGAEISVVLCAHNPREASIRRVLRALTLQQLPVARWELIVVDNGSAPPLATRDLPWPKDTRFIVEPTLGLTPARLAGFAAAASPLLVLIDDDTVPAPNYLEVALQTFQAHPEIGAAGGRIQGEFEVLPPTWASGHLGNLAIRDFGDQPIRAMIANQAGPWEPCGAGMVLRASVARAYTERAQDPRRRGLDRVGAALRSCGDTDLARCAPDLGLMQAYVPELHLTHLIPAGRLRLGYLLRMSYCIGRDGWMLYRLRGRDCALRGRLRVLIHYGAAPLRFFHWHPMRWALRLASALGEIRGRSVSLGE